MAKHITPEERAAFLAYITEHPQCGIREARRKTGVQLGRNDVRELRETDPEFFHDYWKARGYFPEDEEEEEEEDAE